MKGPKHETTLLSCLNLDEAHLEASKQQNCEDSHPGEMTSLGLTDCKPVPGPVEFAVNDPLGRWAINHNFINLTGTSPADQQSSERIQKPLGEQASIITSAHDRILALQRTTVATQIHLSRELVLKVLTALCKSLSKDIITHALEVMGLADVKLLVNLMRLVASGRACIANPTEGSNTFVSEEVLSSSRSAMLKVLGQAVSSLINSQPSSAHLLLQVCVNDLMASATG